MLTIFFDVLSASSGRALRQTIQTLQENSLPRYNCNVNINFSIACEQALGIGWGKGKKERELAPMFQEFECLPQYSTWLPAVLPERACSQATFNTQTNIPYRNFKCTVLYKYLLIITVVEE